MSNTKQMMEELLKPFPTSVVSWRIGQKSKRGDKARVLAYLDARAVMQRLDDVFGIDGWQSKLEPLSNGFQCQLTCRFVDDYNNTFWITKSDVSDFSDIEAIKGGGSGALKRAAVSFGIGRYLYYLDSPWVDIDQYGNFTPPTLPDWALPDDEKGKPQKTYAVADTNRGQQTQVQTNQPSTQPQQEFNKDTFVWGGGKHSGKMLKDTPVDYLQWVVEKSRSPQPVKDMVAEFLSSATDTQQDVGQEEIPF